jgi:hypothetical protein
LLDFAGLINEEEIERVIKNLKPGKSPDIDGISAEHYKNAMDELKPLILHILNTIIEELDIPQMLKRGIMTGSCIAEFEYVVCLHSTDLCLLSR